jgi:TolB-like protein
MPDPTLLQRLKERKLVQWAVAYLAGAWALVEATGLVVAQFHWPEVIGQVVTVLAFFGFFVVLVLAWYHGEQGRQRVSGPELLMVAALLVVAGVALSMVGGSGGVKAPTQIATLGSVEEDRPSIAVLPFQNRSGIEDDAYFTDGLHDQIITHLTKIGGLSVRGLTSVLVYRDTPKNLRQIGEELRARYIIEGGVQRAAGTVRINVQLIEAATDEHLWANSYDRAMSVENLLAIQTEIVEAVADSVRAVVRPEELTRIATLPTQSLEAYDHFIRGNVFYYGWVRESNNRAFEQYRLAVAADSLFADAHARIAMCYAQRVDGELYEKGEEEEELLALGLRSAELAIRLAPERGGGWVAKAYLLRMLNPYDMPTVIDALRVAESLDPRDHEVHNQLSAAFFVVGRDSAALAHDRKAKAIEPDYHGGPKRRAMIAYLDGDLAQALDLFDTVLDLDSDFDDGYIYRGLTKAAAGDLVGATVDADALRQLGPPTQARAFLALISALSGREAEARAMVQEFAHPDREAQWARVLTALGEGGLALEYLEDGRVFLRLLNDPFLDPLRDHPRFKALLEKYEDDVER